MKERVVDGMSTRARMLVLVFGSLLFVGASMGAYAIYEAEVNAARFNQQLLRYPEARSLYLLSRQETQEGSLKMGLAATTLMLLTLVCGLVASRDIVRRLRELRDAARGIALGDLDSPVPMEAHTELDHLAFALDHMRHDLRKVVALSVSNAESERDMAVASAVAAMFLPSERIQITPRVSLAGFCLPATKCGGDLWWHKTLKNGATLVIVGDVTGHGTGPAMIAAAVASALHTLVDDAAPLDIQTLLSELNAAIESICSGEFFVTLCGLYIDPARNEVRCHQAGAPPVLFMENDGKIDVIAGAGTRLGEKAPTFSEKVLGFRSGTRIVCFTDGVTERTLPGGNTFGLRRLRRALASTRNASFSEAAELLRKIVCTDLDATPLEDDITFVMIELGEARP